MKAELIGKLRMVPAGWLDDPPGAASRTLEALLERHLMHGTRKFTFLDDAVRGFGGPAAVGWVGETDQQRQLPRVHHPGGKRRRLLGVGEGPTEAIAGAKQGSEEQCLSRTCESGRVGQKWVSRHVLATCQSQW